MECLRYAHENGCPWNIDTCNYAAENGHIECLRYAHEHRCPWDESTCREAAKTGQLECLQYAHESGCPWNESTCLEAAKKGHLGCLKYAHENGCQLSDTICFWAACRAHIDCLKYAHENGCPWDEDTFEQAATWNDRKRYREAVTDAMVANTVEAIMDRVLRAERERASIVIQRRWLEHAYRPNSRLNLVRNLKRDFEVQRT